MKQSTICITGGHLTPALAVIEEIKRQGFRWKMMFIGRREAFEGGGSPTQEERLVRALGVPFHALTTGRQGRSLFKVPVGFFQAFLLLVTHRPIAVLSFGGYVALPVVIAAWILGIPVVTHEQTENLGLTNRIIAPLTRRVIFARDCGIPIRRALFHPPTRPSFPIDTARPILYITGGSTGAHSLNALIFPIVFELVKTYTVIHQVGSGDISKAPLHGRYVVAEYFDVSDVAWIYNHASLVIGRAGANTVAEVAALGVPALFIPLPWAAGDEQKKNATKLASAGMAVVLDQKTLTGDSLLTYIRDMMRTIHPYKKAAEVVAKLYPLDGTKKIVDVLQSMCS